jgi:hypothetical protein
MAFLVLLLLALPVQAADNVPPCLTQAQAQARWPKAHLYWHTKDKCWDNIPVGQSRSVRPSRVAVSAPAPSQPTRPRVDKRPHDANGNGIELREPPVFFPDTMPGPPPSASMFNSEPATHWPPLIDIDTMAVFKEWNERISGQFK